MNSAVFLCLCALGVSRCPQAEQGDSQGGRPGEQGGLGPAGGPDGRARMGPLGRPGKAGSAGALPGRSPAVLKRLIRREVDGPCNRGQRFPDQTVAMAGPRRSPRVSGCSVGAVLHKLQRLHPTKHKRLTHFTRFLETSTYQKMKSVKARTAASGFTKLCT